MVIVQERDGPRDWRPVDMSIIRIGQWLCWLTISLTASITTVGGISLASAGPDVALLHELGLLGKPIRVAACLVAVASWWALTAVAIQHARARRPAKG